MTGSRFILFLLAVLAAAPIHAETTISLRPTPAPDADNLVRVSVDARATGESLASISSFELSLIYDYTRLTAAGVAPSDHYPSSWQLLFVVQPIDLLMPGHACLRIAGHRIDASSTPPDSTLAVISFRPKDPVNPGETAPVTFYWIDCRSNFLLDSTAATYLTAACALDPDGNDITSVHDAPPTMTGLCNACLDSLARNDTAVTRSLVFESARIPLDIATGIDGSSDDPSLPTSFALDQNYPNPFNAGTTIPFALPRPSPYCLDICDISGRLVRSFTGYAPAGLTAIHWDGSTSRGHSVASGIYLYRLTAGLATHSRTMVLLK